MTRPDWLDTLDPTKRRIDDDGDEVWEWARRDCRLMVAYAADEGLDIFGVCFEGAVRILHFDLTLDGMTEALRWFAEWSPPATDRHGATP